MLRLLSLPPPPGFRMVNAESRRNPFVRLSLLLGALALLALLLTMQPTPAQAADHVTSDQSCVGTSESNRRLAPSVTQVSIQVGNCFTNHGSGVLTFTVDPATNAGLTVNGRPELSFSDFLRSGPAVATNGHLFVTAKPQSELSAITPPLGTEASTPGVFEFEWAVAVTATSPSGSSGGVWAHFKTQYIPTLIDYDSDDDGLIEITNFDQLNAIRHDVDGDGAVGTANQTTYDAAFPNKAAGMGCPTTTDDPDDNDCLGYEIGADSSGAAVNIDLNVSPHNTGMGWAPIAGFAAVFDGNHNTISGLFINRTTDANGLFGTVTAAGKIRNVGLTGVNVTGGNRTGALVGTHSGSITASYSDGSVSGAESVGGLVGRKESGSSVTASYSGGAVSGAGSVGGLVGNDVGSTTASYSTSAVSGTGSNVGGLAGGCTSTIKASYSTGVVTGATGATNIGGLCGNNWGIAPDSYWDTETSGRATSGLGTGKTTSELQTPTAYGTSPSIYANWNLNLDGVAGDDDPWDFGAATDYPKLKYGGLDVLRQHKTDYDGDKDGLIEISTAAQLNAIRHDVDGDGAVDTANQTTYDLAFPNKAAGMGCPTNTEDTDDNDCLGYEIGAGSGAAVNIDLDVSPHNTSMGWTPITGFAATFDGNGNTISGLFIKRTTNDNGLFGTVTAAGKVRNVGLTGVNVSGGSRTGAISGGYAQGFVTSTFSTAGGPVGENAGGTITASHAAVSINGGALSSRLGGLVGSLVSSGTITASYATGAISGHDGIGGLVGAVFSSGTITASYATGAISGNHSIGGLVGNMTLGAITASYSTGRVSGETSSNIGGLVGLFTTGTVTDSYWDTTTSGQASSGAGTGKTTSELQTPTAYGTSPSIYATWNLDLDGDSTNDDPWDFGAATDYPLLQFGGLDPLTQHVTDYDTDNDGLIEISNVAQLNAIRHDVDGNGMVATANQNAYDLAFPDPFPGLGCKPVSDTPTCTGYEIGALPSSFALNIDLNVAPHNADKGWAPIDDFAATFDGNGNTISGLFINDTATDNTADKNGLFGTVTSAGEIRNVGLTGVNVTGRTQTGALAGLNNGTITASYAEGSVTTTGVNTGGLVGENAGGTITASYAAVTVSGGASAMRLGGLVGTSYGTGAAVTASYATGAVSGGASSAHVGGLAGRNVGVLRASYATGAASGNERVGGLAGSTGPQSVITASYATGPVSGTSSTGIGGLIGILNGTVTDSYWDTTTSGQAASPGGTGKTTSELQTPTAYTGIYADWNLNLDGEGGNDDPWNFGTATRYPVLKYGGLDLPRQWLVDYGRDEDGLIEIATAAQLNAIRWDVDGNGAVAEANQVTYAAAFPDPAPGMGCVPVSGTPTCAGYEICAGPSGAAVNIDLNVALYNTGTGWAPIGSFAATFDGNGNTISGLFINRTTDRNGLFGSVTSAGEVRRVGLIDVDVTGRDRTGGLVGQNEGTITASYAAGSVSSSNNYAGGLVGYNKGAITASYSSGAVSGNDQVGGLAGRSEDGTIKASYSASAVTVRASVFGAGGLVGFISGNTSTITASYSTGAVGGSGSFIGGLVGRADTGATATNSYWDRETSGLTTSVRGTGHTTGALKTPTAYTGIYANWNLNLDGAAGTDDPWDFGTATQYPRLKFGGLNPLAQHRVDYDSDNDGLIEIMNATQLNAIRHDVDGNGMVATANQNAYDLAFPEPHPGMGCKPVSGTPTCTGYEIGASTSGAAVNINLNVHPHNIDSGWSPIPGFAATFDGNGNTISGLFINRTTDDIGLFGSVTSTGKVRNVGLTGVNVTGGRRTGALAGTNSGAISGSSAEGTVSGNSFGGLVGKNDAGATITASYANVAVSGVGGVSGPGGGLVGENSGTIRASYATGAVSGHQRIGGLVGSQSSTSVIKASYATGVVSGTGTPLGGLVGSGSNGTVTNSYWNTDTSGQTSSAGGTGKTTSELQTPTAYGTSPSIYANWNLDLDGMAGDDDPWDFGGSADYPALDYGSLSPWASQWKLLLTATAGGRRVTLNWPPGAYGDRPAAIAQWQYRQKEGANAYGAWQSATGSGPNTARHVVTGLTGGDAIDVRASGAAHRTDRNARQPSGHADVGRRDRRRRRGHHPLGLPLQHGRYTGRLAGQPSSSGRRLTTAGRPPPLPS